MKVRIVGKLAMSFKDEEGGKKEGMNLYYYAPKDEVDGFFAGQLWVDKSLPMYNKLLMLDLDRPLMADVSFDVIPGKKMRAVLTDMKLLQEKDFIDIDVKKPA